MKTKGHVLQVGGARFEACFPVLREQGRVVLAHGELTGHAHAISSEHAMLYETAAQGDAALRLGTRILSAGRAVALTHEEHGTIEVPAGTWGVRIQRQYKAGAFRRVED